MIKSLTTLFVFPLPDSSAWPFIVSPDDFLQTPEKNEQLKCASVRNEYDASRTQLNGKSAFIISVIFVNDKVRVT